MPTEILMPALSPTMEEGKLAKWLVKEGQTVKAGDVIAEIETDKATMEVEAVDEGTVGQLLVAEGTEKREGQHADRDAAGRGRERRRAGAGAEAAPAPARERRRRPAPPPEPARRRRRRSSGAAGSPRPARTRTARGDARRTARRPQRHARIFASPLARRLAKEAGIDLAALTGSGPHGRIVQRDIEAALKATAPRRLRRQAPARPWRRAPSTRGGAAPAPQPMADDKILALYEKGSYEVVPHDGMRRVIAQRLTQSKQTIPHFYLTVDCRLDELLRARERINAASPKDGPRAYKLSVNDFVIKALALALQQVPAANVTWTDAGMLRHVIPTSASPSPSRAACSRR